MVDEPASLPVEELERLAAEFARGDLDEAGMRRLLEALRADAGGGAAAARQVWLALTLVTDLRSCLDGPLVDAVRLRLAEDGDFVRGTRRNLGLAAPTLKPVPVPVTPTPVRRRWWRWLMAALATALIALPAWWLLHPATVAVVLSVSGRATLSGSPVVAGDRIDGRLLVLGAGADLALAGDGGGRIHLAGPAAAVVQDGGLALIAGRAWIQTASTTFRLGLPDGRLVAAPGTALAAQAEQMSGVMAVVAGSATSGDGRSLAAGDACAGTTVFPWRPELAAAADGGIAIPPGTPAFDLLSEVRFATDGARLRLRLDAGTDLVLADRRWGEALPGGEPAAWTPLAGPPRSTLRIEVVYRQPRLSVRVDGATIATQDRPQAAVAIIPGAEVAVTTRGRAGPEAER